MRRLSGMAAAGVSVDMELIHGRQPSGLGVRLMIAIALCGACDSRTPTRPSETSSPLPSPPPSPPPSPSPPSPPPAVPHQVGIWLDPESFGRAYPAPIDSDGAYLLDWGAGWYSVGMDNIPSTPAGHCREYRFTFSWLPAMDNLTQFWSGSTWNRGCLFFPESRIDPSAWFQSAQRNSIDALQSIAIVGLERAPNGTATEMFRKQLAIRFRDR
jgi:hypothetical protein